MGARIVDGKSLSLDIQNEVANKVTVLRERGVEPRLAVVIAGEDPASHVYVRNKERACERCGILSTRIDMPATSTLEEIVEVVEGLNADSSIHGIPVSYTHLTLPTTPYV